MGKNLLTLTFVLHIKQPSGILYLCIFACVKVLPTKTFETQLNVQEAKKKFSKNLVLLMIAEVVLKKR